MDAEKRKDYIQLRAKVVEILKETEVRILDYRPDESDADFRFLINKAISYRNVITKIDEELNEETP